MSKNYIRRKNQIDFLNSNKEIKIGKKENLPLSFKDIKEINENSPWVKEIWRGLTTVVYKIKVNRRYYAIKKKREKPLVRNVDGQISFLNEIQRRRDFENLKKTVPQLCSGIVKTIYASLRHGFIISPWIKGKRITELNRKDIYENLFNILYHMECNGFFEWDLCSGNLLLVDGNQVKLFDFGYTYLYNPLSEYNSVGKEEPIFHGIERFETRMLMGYFMTYGKEEEKVFNEYRLEKEIALKYYIKKLKWLEKHGADDDIIIWIKGIIKPWELALSNNDSLKQLYMLESFRSYVLDVNTDITGKCCNFMTLKKIDRILEMLSNDYDLLKQNNGFFWGEELLSKKKLIEKYDKRKNMAIEYKVRK